MWGSDRVLLGDPVRDGFRPAGGEGDHGVIAIALAGQFGGVVSMDFELDADARAGEGIDPGADGEAVAETERAFEIDMGGLDDPAVAGLEEFFHGHAVAAAHLVIAGGQDIIEVAAAMDVAVHVQVVGADLEFGGKDGSAEVHKMIKPGEG